MKSVLCNYDRLDFASKLYEITHFLLKSLFLIEICYALIGIHFPKLHFWTWHDAVFFWYQVGRIQ